jgi:hypothetical protein
MLRTAMATTALAAALTAAVLAQSRPQGFGRTGSAWCDDRGNNDRASFCEVREETVSGVNPLDVDAGRNGGIRVRGWDRDDVLMRRAHRRLCGHRRGARCRVRIRLVTAVAASAPKADAAAAGTGSLPRSGPPPACA